MKKFHALIPKIIADRDPEFLNRSVHKSLADCTLTGSSDEFYVISFNAFSKADAPSVFQTYRILDREEVQSKLATTPSFHRLIVAEEVNSNQSSAETLVVPNGSLATITRANASASFVSDAVVKIVWDWGGANEEVIWTMKGDSEMPFKYEVTGDGVKKLAVEVENTSGGAIWLSGYMELFIDA